ncbi:type II toxin-antitoxin system RelE/ParE family toxin [Candidatus Woesearchaeota archaeon]|nr:type II toxin-antitoxin system RelE/ParE family toxin [Candidatus Woesearchaeota archaeon]
MEVILTDQFKKVYSKIKNDAIKEKIWKQVRKLEFMPEAGKPLSGKLKGRRSVRIAPFRIIYHLEEDKIIIEDFDHRKIVYEKES